MRRKVLSAGFLNGDVEAAVWLCVLFCESVVVQVRGIASTDNEVKFKAMRMPNEEDGFGICWDGNGGDCPETVVFSITIRTRRVRRRNKGMNADLLVPAGASSNAKWRPTLAMVTALRSDDLNSILGMISLRTQPDLVIAVKTYMA